MKLTGNTVLITGGTSGIGQGLAERLAELGNTVIICGRRQDRLDKIAQSNPRIVTQQCDVSDAGQREQLIQWVNGEYPGLNVLINNAGIQLATDLTKPVNVPVIREEIEINLVAPIHLVSLVSPQLQRRASAAIINITSGLAFVPLASIPVYCATKAAFHSITLSLRQQLAGTSVKVFEIVPPPVDTELGYQRRKDKTQSHGGMPVEEFVHDTMQALQSDTYEAGIGSAINLMQQREAIFDQLNAPRPAS